MATVNEAIKTRAKAIGMKAAVTPGKGTLIASLWHGYEVKRSQLFSSLHRADAWAFLDRAVREQEEHIKAHGCPTKTGERHGLR